MLQIRLTDLFSYIPELSHYVFVMAFFCIILGLLWGRFKAMHVFGVVVLALTLSASFLTPTRYRTPIIVMGAVS